MFRRMFAALRTDTALEAQVAEAAAVREERTIELRTLCHEIATQEIPETVPVLDPEPEPDAVPNGR